MTKLFQIQIPVNFLKKDKLFTGTGERRGYSSPPFLCRSLATHTYIHRTLAHTANEQGETDPHFEDRIRNEIRVAFFAVHVHSQAVQYYLYS